MSAPTEWAAISKGAFMAAARKAAEIGYEAAWRDFDDSMKDALDEARIKADLAGMCIKCGHIPWRAEVEA